MSDQFKLVVTVPGSHADVVRAAMAEAGAGKVGRYASCSFSLKGMGRFVPLDGAVPTIGKIGQREEVDEERIEVNVGSDELNRVIEALRSMHPYEEPVVDVYLLAGAADRVRAIEARNLRVEDDKAWETSYTRRGLLIIFTYVAISLYLVSIHVERPWMNAIVPSVGFLLSTLTLPFFKRWWLRVRKTVSNSPQSRAGALVWLRRK